MSLLYTNLIGDKTSAPSCRSDLSSDPLLKNTNHTMDAAGMLNSKGDVQPAIAASLEAQAVMKARPHNAHTVGEETQTRGDSDHWLS